MEKDDLAACYETLEIAPGAPFREVHNAYLRLKKIYSGDSIALAPLGEEFSEKKRKKILDQVEAAYARVIAGRKVASARDAPLFLDVTSGDAAEPEPGRTSFSGQVLKKARERSNIDLSAISKEIKLRIELLKNIEEERYEALPEEIYLKVHLRNYAGCLGLDSARVVEDYLGRYRAWKNSLSK
jgi:hypothetical protein